MRTALSKIKTITLLAVTVFLAGTAAVQVRAGDDVELNAETGGLATIKGVVRDQSGNPIADATVAIFRVGTAKLLKEVRSATDGSFLTRIFPGKYTILAVAEGFNPVTLNEVEVNRASLAIVRSTPARTSAVVASADPKIDA